VRQAGDRSADALGWIASLLIHALTLGAAIVLAADFSLIPRPRPFHWEVSLVAAPQPEALISDLPRPSHTSPVSPSVDTDSHVSETKVSRRAYRPDVKSRQSGSRPVGDTAPSSNVTTAEAVIAELVNGDSLVERPAVSPPEPEPDTEDGESGDLREDTAENNTDSVPPDLASLPVSHVEPDDMPPPDVETPTKLAPVSEPAIQEPDRLAYHPAPHFQDPIVAKTLHADYGWLANDIFAKVEELKRYPYLAKTNRWQGNVVLQAIISHDGGVSDIEVVESSGHAMLDRDAMDLLAQVSPIRLKHPLGQPHIVVQIPIGYRLE
jgi:protein TonB